MLLIVQIFAIAFSRRTLNYYEIYLYLEEDTDAQ